jgi:hypothetical protein
MNNQHGKDAQVKTTAAMTTHKKLFQRQVTTQSTTRQLKIAQEKLYMVGTIKTTVPQCPVKPSVTQHNWNNNTKHSTPANCPHKASRTKGIQKSHV